MKQFPILTRKRLDEITQEVIRNVIKSNLNSREQSLLIKSLNLMRIIQAAPRTTQRYTLSLPVEMVDSLSLELQEHVEGWFASNNDVDTEELTDQNQNFRAERQPSSQR